MQLSSLVGSWPCLVGEPLGKPGRCLKDPEGRLGVTLGEVWGNQGKALGKAWRKTGKALSGEVLLYIEILVGIARCNGAENQVSPRQRKTPWEEL